MNYKYASRPEKLAWKGAISNRNEKKTKEVKQALYGMNI